MSLVYPFPGRHSQTGRCRIAYSNRSTDVLEPQAEHSRVTGPMNSKARLTGDATSDKVFRQSECSS